MIKRGEIENLYVRCIQGTNRVRHETFHRWRIPLDARHEQAEHEDTRGQARQLRVIGDGEEKLTTREKNHD